MKILTAILAALLFYSTPVKILADNAPIKLGDVSMEELTMTSYSEDSTADAVVLCDYGTTTLRLNKAKGQFEIYYTRICRIKIFNESGYDFASESLRLYNDINIREDITKLKGFTHNLEDGKVEKIKLTKKSIFDEKVSDHWTEYKFTMPGVKSGSVIEFEYEFTSDQLAFLRPWSFQKSIPVKWSEYIVEIPEYYNYLKISGGFEPFVINETKESSKTESFTYRSNGNLRNDHLTYRITTYHWAVEKIPSLEDESFVGNVNDYRTKIEFQLSSTKLPGQNYQDFLGTWDDLNKKFLVDLDDFKKNLETRSFYRDDLEKLLADTQDEEQKIALIYNYLSEYLEWDGSKSYFPSKNIKKTYEERTGNSADINSLLISMLKAADIKAEPVILSTRDHGQIHPVYPILRKYNYLIAVAYAGDKKYLLDATEKNIPAGMLPVRCLNSKGWCLSLDHAGWINLEPTQGAQNLAVCNLTIENGELKGNIQIKKSGYSGMAACRKLSTDGEEKFMEYIEENYTDWAIEDYDLTRSENELNVFTEKYNLSIGNSLMEGGNMIYIDPVIFEKWEENPLKNPERKFPVDFNFPMQTKYMLNLIIPEGYSVEEIPKSIKFSLPDKSATYLYMANIAGNTIQIVNQFDIKKCMYLPQDYQGLREFWAMVVSKNNEQIVLKKNE